MKRRILLAPDSFKGTLSADQLCRILKEEFQSQFPTWELVPLPMADGGEGFVETCLALCPGRRITCRVTGPMGRPVSATYALMEDGTAVVEMAAAAGLPLVGEEKDPMTATTYGVGQLLCHAREQGASRILLGLGGSATNDGGIGMARALGWRFYDAAGRELPAQARYLGDMVRIVPPDDPFPLPVTAACDVKNPLFGPQGATYVFGPQKGVQPQQLPVLDGGLRHLSDLLEALCGIPVGTVPGSGAAGGMGAAVLSFLQGSLSPGIELLLDMAGFDGRLDQTALVITGEGRLDRQSAFGKVPAGVAGRCKARGVPCIALCGSIGEGAEALYDLGLTAMFSAIRGFADPSTIVQTCEEDFRVLSRSVARLLRRWMDTVPEGDGRQTRS